jgi:hypothetical protein
MGERPRTVVGFRLGQDMTTDWGCQFADYAGETVFVQ